MDGYGTNYLHLSVAGVVGWRCDLERHRGRDRDDLHATEKVKPKQAKPKQKPGRHKRETGQPKAERRMQHPILRLEPRLADLLRKNHRFVAH